MLAPGRRRERLVLGAGPDGKGGCPGAGHPARRRRLAARHGRRLGGGGPRPAQPVQAADQGRAGGPPVAGARPAAARATPSATAVDPGAAVRGRRLARAWRASTCSGRRRRCRTGGWSCDPAEYEAVRIAAGIPRMGAELTDKTIPGETGLIELTVSFTKGCYTGQELVARIDSRGGNVPRHLRRLVPGRTGASRGPTLRGRGRRVGGHGDQRRPPAETDGWRSATCAAASTAADPAGRARTGRRWRCGSWSGEPGPAPRAGPAVVGPPRPAALALAGCGVQTLSFPDPPPSPRPR